MTGDRKWILLSYLAITFILGWVVSQIVGVALMYLRLRNPMILGVLPLATVGSYAAVGAAAFLYFRQEKVNVFANEVMQELRKVTWPARKIAWQSTVVVIVSVFIVAVILGFFDWICAGFIRLVLRV